MPAQPDAATAPPQAPFPRVAVVIPCLNEAAAIPAVVRSFRAALPHAAIWVCDNGSADGTEAAARDAGAAVCTEMYRGKGNAVRRLFADVEADIYILVDGDATYDAAAAPALVQMVQDRKIDMVCGRRITADAASYRRGHQLGNALLTGCVAAIFGNRVRDMLTGYRAMSRRFVKSFPALSTGFEIETELTVHALELRVPIAEVDTAYVSRPAGSASKLRTVRDGGRILRTIALLVREERPLAFFAALGALLLAAGAGLAVPLFLTYARTGLVPRLPTAVLSTGLVLLGFLSLVCGLVLDTVTTGRREMKRLAYLAQGSPPGR